MKTITLNSRALLYLTASLLLTLQMHMDRLPVWILLAAAGSLLWRLGVHLGRVASPHWSIKGALVLLGFSGIYLTYGRELSIESMVSLLVAGFALKPLEVEKQADSYVLIFLCYLLIGLHFLFEQGPLDYLWVMCVLVVVLTTQISVNQSLQKDHEEKSSNDVHWQALSLFLKSLPLAAFLFFVLPRLGPLWVLNIPTQDGVIGLSDSMSPGQIAELGKSDELAFRVRFDSQVPAMKDQYWRALVLDYFDGETWSQRYQPPVDWQPAKLVKNGAKDELIKYEILLQPHDQKWLFSLGVASPETSEIGVSDDARLISKKAIHGQMQYFATSNLSGAMQQDGLSALALNYYLQLPSGDNPRSREFAQTLKTRFPAISDFTYALQRYFNGTEFYYTLNPGELETSNTIDEFLFDSRKGFCAHYAGSLVYLMRSVGIPARVVLGYLGVEENPVANYYSVYQYNAHAWVEIWLQGRGWVKIDPTGWVAPERIEQGLEEAVKRDFAGFSSNSPWLKAMRNQFNALNYYWNDWMLNYKGAAQQQLMNQFFGDRSETQLILLVLACLFSAVGIGFVFMFLDVRREKLSNEQKLLYFYRMKLQSFGIQLQTGSSLAQMSELALAVNPHLQVELHDIRLAFERSLYVNPDSRMTRDESKALKKCIKLMFRKFNRPVDQPTGQSPAGQISSSQN